MRDWVKSTEGLDSEKRNRFILNVAIVSLFSLMVLITVTEAIRLIDASAKVENATTVVARIHSQEDGLFALDALTSRGLIITEFMDALAAGDLFVADSIRTRLISARQLLLSEGMMGLPKDTRIDLSRLLGIYANFELSTYSHNNAEGAAFNLIPLNAEVDTKTLIADLQSLRAYQKNWMTELAGQALGSRRLNYTQSFLVILMISLGFIPLCCGIITSRYFAREHQQLLNTREYFNRLISSLPGLVLLTDRSGAIIGASKAVTEFLGHSEDWYVGATVAQILPKRFRQQYQLYCQNHLKLKGTMVKGRELLLLSADDRELPVELHFGDFATLDGDVLVVCFSDVRERRALYQRYQRVQRRFDMAMTASRDGLWDWDLSTNEVLFSASWLEMMGILGGHPLNGLVVFEDCVLPEDRPRVKRELEAFFRGKELLFRTEHRLRRRDGGICDVVSRACAQRDSSGKVVRMVGVHSDVTSFKEVEREVLRLNRNLEDRVRLRTQQLENALVSAEAANSAKAAFLSVMGHEIRTPMNGVIGMTDLLSKTTLDREQRMMVDTVRRSSQSLLATLDHILDYVALESGSVEIIPEEIQLVEFIEGLVDSVGLDVAKNKQRFILHVEPGVPPVVLADAGYLGKVIRNLIDNAIKFSVYTVPQGVIQLRVALAADQANLASGQQRLEIKVIDNGIGISSEQRGQLFEPFVQIESNRARRFGGTGLGLAISARIVALMGGQLALSSGPEEETCFTGTLVFDVPEVAVAIEKARNIEILACIPDPLLHNALAAILEVNAYSVTWFTSTAELSSAVAELTVPGVVLALAADQDTLNYCAEHNLKVLKLSERPRDKATLRLDLVYTDPLLPSALLRALEREQRVLSIGL